MFTCVDMSIVLVYLFTCLLGVFGVSIWCLRHVLQQLYIVNFFSPTLQIKKSCKRLLRKKLRCKNITDHEHFKRDALRRMAAFEALLHQSKHCLRKQRQVDEDQKVIEATLIAIRGFLVNTSERSANPWKYYCELPSGMCNRDTIREQLWIISTKLGEQLKCFVKILPTTSTPSDSDGETTPKPQKKRTRKDDRKRETNAKKGHNYLQVEAYTKTEQRTSMLHSNISCTRTRGDITLHLKKMAQARSRARAPVSYTHLTLPTMAVV